MSAPRNLRRLLARPGAWLEVATNGYAVRAGSDRRARVLALIDEAAFRSLAEEPGLRVRPKGGWTTRPEPPSTPPPPPGRPGMIEGQRPVIEADGRMTLRRANLGASAIVWLAARTCPDGEQWLGAAEVAAARRLEMDAELALCGSSLTMRWDGLPRSGSGGLARREPADHALGAARRVETALAACGAARGMVEAVCIRASALQAAERSLGLRRRSGKALLREGLQALAAHYRIG
jgi:hypothetical protein